jgi:ankyrin repeat protein
VNEELARACVAGDVTTLRNALSRGAKPDTRFRGATLLQWAAQENRAAVVRLLLTAGANPNAADRSAYGVQRPLHAAAGAGYITVVRLLLRAGAKTNPKTRGGGTPLHTAAAYGHLNCVRALVKAGADVGARDGEGRRPAYYARRYRHEAVVNYLREHDSA